MSDTFFPIPPTNIDAPRFYGGSEFARQGASSSRLPMDNNVLGGQATQQTPSLTDDPAFDIIEWFPAYQSCQKYFLDVSQYEPGTQAVCSLINIRLPFQWLHTPVQSHALQSPTTSHTTPFTFTASRSGIASPERSRASSQVAPTSHVSLIPYIRRLIITGFDKPAILHGFFGDDYMRGVMPHVDCERRNYLFSAKAGGWRSCKKMYDVGSAGGGDETVPFLKPLDQARMEELMAAEKAWSSWLAMEDWMVGPRAPADSDPAQSDNKDVDGVIGQRDPVNGANRDFVT